VLNQTADYIFPDAILGYAAQIPKGLSITNTGSQRTGALTLALTGTGASAFTLNPASTAASLAVGGGAAKPPLN
jgi:hypothetical protein